MQSLSTGSASSQQDRAPDQSVYDKNSEYVTNIAERHDGYLTQREPAPADARPIALITGVGRLVGIGATICQGTTNMRVGRRDEKCHPLRDRKSSRRGVGPDTAAVNADPPTVTLWRPTGPRETVFGRGHRLAGHWPPRLPEQPIFYPGLNRD